jgi:acetyltransferase-like isoleucine patch superfamily enzyme
MDFLFRVLRRWPRLQIWFVRKIGIEVADDCVFVDLPDFGTEPYLISIGKHVGVAKDVVFMTHDGGTRVFREQERYRKVIKYGRINILDNCVIGQRATIMPGVTIGPNSVVAAGSVVSRNVPANTLVAGNPAKPVMSIEQYAEWALAATPDYDVEDYHRDKKAFLLRMTLRGSRKTPPQG